MNGNHGSGYAVCFTNKTYGLTVVPATRMVVKPGFKEPKPSGGIRCRSWKPRSSYPAVIVPRSSRRASSFPLAITKGTLMHSGARTSVGPLFLDGTPVLGFGAWAIGGGGWGEPESESERIAAIELARERGVTVFDTAPTYGDGASERLLGRVLKPHRDRVRIATKVGPRDDPRRSLEDSLRRLDSDYVDLIQLHETLERWEWQVEALHTVQIQGKAC